jgi:hypothetical protein
MYEPRASDNIYILHIPADWTNLVSTPPQMQTVSYMLSTTAEDCKRCLERSGMFLSSKIKAMLHMHERIVYSCY